MRDAQTTASSVLVAAGMVLMGTIALLPQAAEAACAPFRSPAFDYVPGAGPTFGDAPHVVSVSWGEHWSWNSNVPPVPTFYIDWGDGTRVAVPHEDCLVDGDPGQPYRDWPAQTLNHVYATAGIYPITFETNPGSISTINTIFVSEPPSVPTHQLSVTKAGTGTGNVGSAPAGISCGSDCTESYNEGTTVTLTASATGSSTFSGWGGACTGTGTCSVAMDAAKSVTATFSPAPVPTYTLSVSVTQSGGATGRVTSSDAKGKIFCPGTCSGSFAMGTRVTLSSFASGDSTFTGWGGACASRGTSSTCTVAMNAAKSVSAGYVLNPINGCPAGSTKSGASWITPTETATSTLSQPFRGNLERFMKALRDAGVKPAISSARRTAERAYLMHYSYRIAKDGFDPRNVPTAKGVNICWAHKTSTGALNLTASRTAAQAMVDAYGIVSRPAINSNHIPGSAVDMQTAWTTSSLKIKDASGKLITITTTPRDRMNTQLWAVARTYGVIKFGDYPGGSPTVDKVHWSLNGR